MKITQTNRFLGIVFFAAATALAAQADMEQKPAGMPADMVTAKPEGGFSKSIGGKWNCGKYGTMTLTDTKGKVSGTYTFNKGTVTGTVKDNTFSGDWKEAKTGKKGNFKLKVSIRRMTPHPTNLEGTKTVAAMGAKAETFACEK
jgi:hypothetical protein